MSSVVAALCGLLCWQGTEGLASRAGSVDRQRAFYLAEAGLAEGLRSLRSGGNGNIGSAQVPARFGEGVLWVTCSIGADGRARLESTGVAGRTRARLAQSVGARVTSLAALGFFGDEVVHVEPDVRIGILGGRAATETCAVGSSGDVYLQSSVTGRTTIEGDATPGPNGSVEAGANCAVQGSTAPRAAVANVPVPTVPALEPVGSIDLAAGGERRIDGEAWHCPTVAVAADAVLTIEGGSVLVTDRLELAPGATLIADAAGGPIELWVSEALVWSAGARVVTVPPDAENLSIVLLESAEAEPGSGAAVELLGHDNPFHGAIFAPTVDLALRPGTELTGTVVARSLSIGAGSRLRFDPTLSSATGAGTEATLESLVWRILEPPHATTEAADRDFGPAVERTYDRLLPSPAAAEAPTGWGVAYVDGAGALRRYFGHRDSFDWTAAERVVEVYSDAAEAARVHGECTVVQAAAIRGRVARQGREVGE